MFSPRSLQRPSIEDLRVALVIPVNSKRLVSMSEAEVDEEIETFALKKIYLDEPLWTQPLSQSRLSVQGVRKPVRIRLRRRKTLNGKSVEVRVKVQSPRDVANDSYRTSKSRKNRHPPLPAGLLLWTGLLTSYIPNPKMSVPSASPLRRLIRRSAGPQVSELRGGLRGLKRLETRH